MDGIIMKFHFLESKEKINFVLFLYVCIIVMYVTSYDR